MPVISLKDLNDPRLAVFSRMTDAELRDPKQLVGLARAIDATGVDATSRCSTATSANPERLANGLFIGESKNVIERALSAGIEPFALLVEECWLEHERPLVDALLARDQALPAFVATREQMRALTGFERTRGALAAFHRPALPRVEDLLANARRVAVIEDVTNHTNIGAIFRSAAALGVDAVLVAPRCHDPFYRRAARVSMGTVFQVPWTRIGDDAGEHNSARNDNAHDAREHAAPAASAVSSWAECGIPLLHKLGFTTAALALSDDSISLRDERLHACDKLALVLGTEGDGLAARTIATCDYTVRIPMTHDVDSLNVAAASAVAFWELCAQ